MLALVHDGHDHDFLLHNLVDQTVTEPLEKKASLVHVLRRTDVRMNR